MIIRKFKVKAHSVNVDPSVVASDHQRIDVFLGCKEEGWWASGLWVNRRRLATQFDWNHVQRLLAYLNFNRLKLHCQMKLIKEIAQRTFVLLIYRRICFWVGLSFSRILACTARVMIHLCRMGMASATSIMINKCAVVRGTKVQKENKVCRKQNVDSFWEHMSSWYYLGQFQSQYKIQGWADIMPLSEEAHLD